MEYQELRILLRGTSGGSLTAQVIDSPWDERPVNELEPPVSECDLDRLSEVMEQRVRAAEGRTTKPPGNGAPAPTAKGLGMVLFEAVFAGEVGELYRRCRRELSREQGLRLRLVFDPKDPQGSEYLSRLPWELLYDPGSERFVARERRLPVVRDLDWRAPRRDALHIEPPLRILLVDAAPKGMHELNLRSERDRIDEALAPLEMAGDLELYQTGNLARMRELLLDQKIHVLHFMGHGGYSQASGLGAIWFESPSGEMDQVDGDELGEFLSDLPDLGLVVLNACHGARYSGAPGRPAHHGVAAGILQRSGLPAVVAMQHAISDPSAISFARCFYRRLAKGDAVDTALSEARLGLSQDSAEWATPVLFMSAKEGKIFAVESSDRRQPVQRELRARLLGIRSMKAPPEDDLGRPIPHITDDHIDVRDFFEGRYIRDDRLWLDEVYPRLCTFLDFNTRGPRPVELMFAAHTTVGYAAGWLLKSQKGLKVTVLQPTKEEGIRRWSADDGSAPASDEPLWAHDELVALPGGGPDVAVALGQSRAVRGQVEAYLEKQGLPVGRLLDAEIAGGAGQDKVAGGAHAHRLAESLADRIGAVPRAPGSKLHLFAAAPLALVFFLGQLGRAFGKTVLYEYAFGAADAYARYRPSLTLPPPGEGQEPPPGW